MPWFILFLLLLAVMEAFPREATCSRLPDIYWNSTNPMYVATESFYYFIHREFFIYVITLRRVRCIALMLYKAFHVTGKGGISHERLKLSKQCSYRDEYNDLRHDIVPCNGMPKHRSERVRYRQLNPTNRVRKKSRGLVCRGVVQVQKQSFTGFQLSPPLMLPLLPWPLTLHNSMLAMFTGYLIGSRYVSIALFD